MNTINKELETARHGLLDLTMRNHLLNFKPSKARTIKVVDEISKEVYNQLVLQEKTMEFLRKSKNVDSIQEHPIDEEHISSLNTNSENDEASILWKMPEPDMQLEGKHTDRYLQTTLKSEDLQKKLYYISKQSQSAVEEQGYTVLYLALGFLEWNDSSDSSNIKRAPLILIPVELTRANVHGSFKVSWTGEDIFTNISLQAKISEYGVLLPDFEMPDEKEGVDQYFQDVLEAVGKKEDWKILSDISLSFFSFTKFVMYKDLDPVTWPENITPSEHHLIECIFDPEEQTCKKQFSETDVDKQIKAKDVYHVMDADPSQIAVIEDVKSGNNLVVEGPPGTGKSQTITNIIAEILASGKTVLFVSEKMAALEVVKSRLDQAGVGDFCLELHSKKAKKKEILKELERTIHLPSPKSISLDSRFDRLESLKEELNNYSSELREPFGSIKQSPFNLFCMKEIALRYFENVGKDMPILKLPNTKKFSQSEWTEAIESLSNISDILPLVKPVCENHWKGCTPGMVLPSDEIEIETMIDDCKLSVEDLTASLEKLAQLSSIRIPCAIKDFEPAISAARVVAASKPIDKEVLVNESWDEGACVATPLISKVSDFQKQLVIIQSLFTEDVFNKDIESIMVEYKDLYAKYHIVQFFDNECIDHPWRTSSSTNLSLSDITEIEKLIDKCKISLNDLNNAIHQVTDNCSIHKPLTIEDIKPSISAARVVAASKPVDKEVLLNKEWNEQSSEAKVLIKKLEDYQKQNNDLHATFRDNAFDQDIDSINKEYKELSAKFFIFRLFSGRYRYLKKEISSYYKDLAPKNTEIIVSNLNDLSECLISKKEIHDAKSSGQSLFGSHWNDEKSDPKMLASFADWIVSFRQQLLKDAFSDQIVDTVSSGVSKENVEKMIEQLNKATDYFVCSGNDLANRIGISPNLLFSTNSQNITFENIRLQLEQWKNGIVHFQKWASFSRELYRSVPPEKLEEIVIDLDKLSAHLELKKEIISLDETGEALFGSYWKGEKSEAKILESFTEWVVSFREHLLDGLFDQKIIENIVEGISKNDLENATENVLKNKELFVMQRDELFNRLNLDHELLFVSQVENIPFEKVNIQLQLWKEAIPELQKWGQFTVRREECLNTIASPIIDIIDLDLLEASDIIPCFEGNFAENLLRDVFIQRKTLANFMGELHEKKINSFTELDAELIIENRQRLAHLLYKKQPSIISGASPRSEAGILLGEFNKKRKHLPIRQLMKNAGSLIQKIKPCFMMSPLSIAQFLDPSIIDFDVVIFDEASQVKPEDALGALLRGRQCVIIGDTRQLPPTSFFDNMIDSIDETDEEITTSLSDVESILHLCKRSFLTKNLLWHYRSRHESLIAVSNQEFYDQRLVTYPSPMADIEHLGLKFVHLPDTIYERGRNSGNRKEAKLVAQAALEHFKENPNKSLGIGTFNAKQQQIIQEEVDMLLMDNPDMGKFFDSKRSDHFFVKNLETIQGDERDVIFISVGFGFDKDKKLSLNFGPLNREGGERRLNVLITRAREKCVVYSNFQAKDLTLSQTSPFGVKALKVFLDFAENRNLHSIDTEKDTSSAFEESVYSYLCNCGYEVEKKVGCAGYLVDLAIKDPDCPGTFFLGIEFDGEKYHSSSVARDRDRLRQQVLENLGWKIYRIWSTDWYRNKNDCQVRLKKFIEKAKQANSKGLQDKKKNLKHSLCTKDNSVERIEVKNNFKPEKSLLDTISNYKICTTIDIDTTKPIPELAQNDLEKAILQILDVEAPIHIEELVKRIRENHGLKRTGNKIKKAIFEAVDYALKNGNVIESNDFLWKKTYNRTKVRQRGKSFPAKIELICDEEISEAIKLVIKAQHATSPDELAIQTSRLFGIKSTSEMVAERINNVINSLIEMKKLKKLSNGMLDFA